MNVKNDFGYQVP